MKKSLKYIIAAAAVIALGGLAWYCCKGIFGTSAPHGGRKSVLVFTEVEKADIERVISATGTVEPEELVNVGAQVNGKIMSFGTDADGKTIDFGSKVTKGMLLAQIDDITYKAALQEAEASLEQAEASILSAEAAIKDCDANERLARNNWERAQHLYQQKSMTKSDYDSYEAAFYSAGAQMAKATAALAQAKASKSIANAALTRARRNLEYCVIVSPVDGIIIDRRVSIGQTVVSNQTASSIFLVAKDFKKMQVWVSVNEADVGSIKKGTKVRFSCDAFPNKVFHGEVHRLRLNATLSSNVVTYIVEVNVDNPGGELIPYLTANVKFIRAGRYGVTAVPSAVLRYTPPALAVPPELQATGRREAVLWLETSPGQPPRPVKVKVGLNNGQMAEIISDEIREGDRIVCGEEIPDGKNEAAVSSSAGQETVQNPFMPQMPKGQPRGSAGRKARAAQREQKQQQQQKVQK